MKCKKELKRIISFLHLHFYFPPFMKVSPESSCKYKYLHIYLLASTVRLKKKLKIFEWLPTTILIHSQFGKNSFNSSKAPSSTSMGPGRKGGKVGDIRSNLSSRNGGQGLDSLDSEQANRGLSLSASKNSWMMTPKVKFINDVTSNKFIR